MCAQFHDIEYLELALDLSRLIVAHDGIEMIEALGLITTMAKEACALIHLPLDSHFEPMYMFSLFVLSTTNPYLA